MEIDKNTVSAQGQLPLDSHITFEEMGRDGIKVAFVGNSITRHGRAPQIGWNCDWGMAASAKEKDYVHVISKGLEDKNIAANICICNASEWERTCGTGVKLQYFEKVKLFRPDVLVMRIVENWPVGDFLPEVFEAAYDGLIEYLRADNTRIILSTGFWKHPGDEIIMKIAGKKRLPCVYLGELGEMESMKAAGRFAHTGVAAHPGDAGMEWIAKKLFEKIIC